MMVFAERSHTPITLKPGMTHACQKWIATFGLPGVGGISALPRGR